MAAPAKQGSRWGSLLQQAVGGLESRLDNLLAEGQLEDAAKGTKSGASTPGAQPPVLAKPDNGNPQSRSASKNRKPEDRLQERLARAVAAKNASQKSDLLPASTTATPRSESPITSPRQSIDARPNNSEDFSTSGVDSQILNDSGDSTGTKSEAVIASIEESSNRIEATPTDDPKELNDKISILEAEEASHPTEISQSTNSPELIEGTKVASPEPQIPTETEPEVHPTDQIGAETAPTDGNIILKQSDIEALELQRQEETHGYIERIDALQAKLQYLARESAESARKASASATAGSLDKKLADKEEQVALLMEEGQQLSKRELAHLTTIKKLRVKLQDYVKEGSDAKNKQDKAQKDILALTEKAKRTEGLERRLNEKQKAGFQLQKEIDSLKAEKEKKDAVINDLKKQLDDAKLKEKQNEAKIANEALDVEKRRAAELEDDLANANIEKGLAADRAKIQIRELNEQIDKQAESSRMNTLEMKAEQQMLESKLEVMRARAEEVSSGATGDAQAQLLRQIETLQTQYAVASENWQGIESSMAARVMALERERDEANRREADVRRKARELNMKVRRNEEELEETRSKLPDFQTELAEHKSELDNLQSRASQAEAALVEATAAFEREKSTWSTEIQQRIEEEKQKWQEDANNQVGQGMARAESPVTSVRRGITSEYLGLQNLQSAVRRASARSINGDTPVTDRFPGRRPSIQPIFVRGSGSGTPTRQDSVLSLGASGDGQDTPSLPAIDQDEFFDGQVFPSSPQQTLHDMVSVSTAGAGPSVQLVERMSSTVRRLESEMVATKEDLTRLSAQRDEARAEIVALMKEVEAKRAGDAKILELQAEIEDIHSRYQTTLEMLGEKSEMVEELKSDIIDIKEMYRELVERTVK